mgnify:CR=1 FL=1
MLEGHGCPKCGGALKKDNELFLKQLEDKQQLIEPLEEYINAKTKILCRCKICHNEWKVLPNKLLEGNGCPLCASRRKTSFPEQAIYYYIKQVFPDAINRYNVLKNRCELDIYIPSKKIGIEYDGIYWHKNKVDLEKGKYEICKSQGITLLRIRENEGEEDNEKEELTADDIILRKYPYVSDTLDDSIEYLMRQLKIKVDIDTQRDSIKIQEQYYRELAYNSLQQKYPNVSEEWHMKKTEILRLQKFHMQVTSDIGGNVKSVNIYGERRYQTERWERRDVQNVRGKKILKDILKAIDNF